MKYSVIISDKAKRQIGEHIAFISNVNKESARKLKRNLIESLKNLSKMPQRYPYLNGESFEKNYYRKMLLAGRYLAIYHIENDIVHIDYVIDCRQDYQWLFN